MSIYVKLDDLNKDKPGLGQTERNVSRPWYLDIGSVLLGLGDKEFKPFTRVFKTAQTGDPKLIWPNHDCFRFGLLNVVDEKGEHTVFTNANYPNLEAIPSSYYYPHRYRKIVGDFEGPEVVFQTDDVGVTEYNIFTCPCEYTLVFYLRNCNYRYTKRYSYKYEIEGKTWLVNEKIENYEGNKTLWTDNETSNYNDLADSTFTVTQLANKLPEISTAMNEERIGRIIFRQYDKDSETYTGKVIIINITQLRDRVISGTQEYELTWYADAQLTVENAGYYPEAPLGGGTINTYFKIHGIGQTWAGGHDEGKTGVDIYFKQYDYLNESVSDVSSYITPENKDISLGALTWLGYGGFHTPITFTSNDPYELDGTGDANATISIVNWSNDNMPCDQITAQGRFQIQKGLETEDRSTQQYVVLTGNYRTPNPPTFSNPAFLGQGGASVADIITSEYSASGSYISTDWSPSDEIDSVTFTPSGDWVIVTLKVKSNNDVIPIYNLISTNLTPSSISSAQNTITLQFAVSAQTGSSDAKKYTFTIVGNSSEYGQVTQIASFDHTGATESGSYLVKLADMNYTVDTDGADSMVVGSASQATNNIVSIPITVPENTNTSSDNAEVTSIGKFKKSGSSYSATNDMLLGDGETSSPTYYIGFELKVGSTSSVSRTITVLLSVSECESNPTALLWSGECVQSGGVGSNAGTSISNATGFVLTNTTDTITISNQQSYDSATQRYYIPVSYKKNTTNVTSTGGEPTGPYSIVDISNEGWNDSDNGSVTFFRVVGTAAGQSGTRAVTFVLKHDTYIKNNLSVGWNQAGASSSMGTGYVEPNETSINKLVFVSTPTYSKNIGYKVDASTNNYFKLIVTGTNITLHNTITKLQGAIDDGEFLDANVDLSAGVNQAGGSVELKARIVKMLENKDKSRGDETFATSIKYVDSSYGTASSTIKYTGEVLEVDTSGAGISWSDNSEDWVTRADNASITNPRVRKITIGQNTSTSDREYHATATYATTQKIDYYVNQGAEEADYVFTLKSDAKYCVESNLGTTQTITVNLTSTKNENKQNFIGVVKFNGNSSIVANPTVSANAQNQQCVITVPKLGTGSYSSFDIVIELTQTTSNKTLNITLTIPEWNPYVNA